MPKTRDELLAMTQEELADYTVKQLEIKADMTTQQTNLKNEIKTLKTSNTQLTNQFDEVNAKLNDYTQANTKQELTKKLVEFNIQDKFLDDVITKANLTLDLEDDKLKEQVSKTLETYPEYKTQPATINVGVEKMEPKIDAKQAYLDAIKGKTNK